MPLPVVPWVDFTFPTAKSLNLALYTCDGTQDNPNGVAFQTYRPAYFGTASRALTLHGAVAGTVNSLASVAGTAPTTNSLVIYDTAGFFGAASDQPGGKGFYQFTAAVDGGAGDGITPGGWSIFSHFTAVNHKATQTNIGADIMQNSVMYMSGSRQAPSTANDNCAFFLDLVNTGTFTWQPAARIYDSAGTTATTAVNVTDSSGETSRFYQIWAGASTSSAGAVTYSANGIYNWTAPLGVSSVVVRTIGAGGGGGAGNVSGGGGAGAAYGGGGAGGGEFSSGTVSVTPSNNYPVTVGIAGAGGTGGSNGGAGGISSFTGDSVTITGHGGSGGSGATTSTNGPGGAGGTGSSSSTHFNGGAGAPGVSGTFGGGGGSSAGSGSAGNSASDSTGGAAPIGGGVGGNGGSLTIAVVQKATGNSTSASFDLHFPHAVQAGNTVIAVVSGQAIGTNTPTCVLSDGTAMNSDTSGSAAGDGGANANFAIFSIFNVTGGQTGVTVGGMPSKYRGNVAQIYEVAGLGPSPSTDQSNTANGTNSGTYDVTVTTTAAPELWIGATAGSINASSRGALSFGSPGGAWIVQNEDHSDNYDALRSGYQISTTAGILTWKGSVSPKWNWVAGAVSYVPSITTPGAAPLTGSGGGGGAGLGANDGGSGFDGYLALNWAGTSGSAYGTPALPAPLTLWPPNTVISASLLNGSSGIKGVLDFLNNAPMVRAHSVTGQSIVTATVTTVAITTGTTTDVDNFNGFNGGTNTYVVQRDGLYLAHGLVAFNQAGTGYRVAGISINGTVYWGPAYLPATAGGTYCTKTQMFTLFAGDTVKLVCRQDSGSSLTLSSTDQSRLFLVWLSAAPLTGSYIFSTGLSGWAGTNSTLALSSGGQTVAGTQQLTATFSSTGPGTWVAPAGCLSPITVQCWGGGGGGAAASQADDDDDPSTGGGGGGGEYSTQAIAVTAGSTYSYIVGTAGLGGSGTEYSGTGANGTAGGNSSFTGDSVTVTAHGGSGGQFNPPHGEYGPGGAGGTGSTNTIHFNGGAGGAGDSSQEIGAGAGGGGSAGTSVAGLVGASSSSGGDGAAPVTGGGPGGNGGPVGGVGSAPPAGPGGGGGGSGDDEDDGGPGWAGQVQITYTVTTPSVNTGPSLEVMAAGGAGNWYAYSPYTDIPVIAGELMSASAVVYTPAALGAIAVNIDWYSASTYEATVAADTPAAWWELDDPACSYTAADSSGNGWTGNAAGISFGQLGAALLTDTSAGFSGSLSSILSSYNPSGISTFSVEAWVNLNNLPQTGNPRLVSNSFTSSTHTGFELMLGVSGGNYYPNIFIGNGTTTGNVSAGSPLSASGWHYIAATWNGTTITLYVDGVSAGTVSLSGTLAAGATGIGLGSPTTYGGTDFLNGNLAEAGVYTSTLTGARITAHYNAASHLLSTTSGITTNTLAAHITTVNVNGTAPASAAYARLSVLDEETSAAGTAFFIINVSWSHLTSAAGSLVPPDPSFRWASGTPGSALPALFQQHIANDLGFLCSRPYLEAYQTVAQSGLATGGSGSGGSSSFIKRIGKGQMNSTSATSFSVSVSSGTSGSGTLIVTTGFGNQAGTVSSITDTKGNNYIFDYAVNTTTTSGRGLEFWHCTAFTALTTSDSLTITLSTTQDHGATAIVDQYSSLVAADASTFTYNSSSSGTSNSTTLTATASDSLVVSATAVNKSSAGGFAVSGGFTASGADNASNTGSSGIDLQPAYDTSPPSGGGNVTPSFTWSTGASSVTAAVGYPPVTSGGSGSFYTVTLDTLAGIIHGEISDTYGGWTSGSGNLYTAQVSGWYLIAGEVFTTATAASGATVIGGILVTTSGGRTPSVSPDWFQQLTATNSVSGGGATVFGLYYLLAGETVILQVKTNSYAANYGTLTGTHNGGQVNSHMEMVWVSS